MVEAMVALMNYQGTDAAEPVNAGSSDEKSMTEVVDCLGQMMGRSLAVEHLPLPSDDPLRRRPDCTRAKDRLRWQPKVSLVEGLRRTVA